MDSALQQRGHTEKLSCPIRRSPDQRLVGLFIAQLWKQKFAARDCGRDAQRIVSKTREDRLLRPITRRAGRGDLVLFPALGNHAGLQTSDLRSAGTRALDSAAASGSTVAASSGYPIRKKGENRAPRCPLNVDSSRLLRASTRHSPKAWRTGQTDPKGTFNVAPVNERQAPESGLR